MGNSLVITGDRQVAAEFETVAAVTGASVTVASDPTAAQLAGASRVFVDAAAGCDIEHRDVVVVVQGVAGPAQWSLAARLAARTILELPLQRGLLSDLLGGPVTAAGVTVGVIPTVGGAGASTLAVALGAHAAKCGLRAVVVDGDSTLGGLDILVGVEAQPGARWSREPGGTDVAGALPRIDGLDVLSADVRYPRQLSEPDLAAVEALRAGCEVVILDLPRAGAMSPSLVGLCDFVVYVTVNTVRATAATATALATPVPGERGVVVRMVPGARLDAMGVAESLDTALWGTLPTDARVVEQVEQGLGPGAINLGGYTRSLAHIAGRVLAGVQGVAA